MGSKKRRPEIQGHRGARGSYPENTIQGFIEALKTGVDTLEMDVVISADRKVVVSHEPWMSDIICSRPDGEPVERNSREKYNLYRMKYEEIRSFDCGKRGNISFPDQKALPACKPILDEVIRNAEDFTEKHGLRRTWYNIETKSTPETDDIFHPGPEEFVSLLYDRLREYNILDRTIIQSFDIRTLQVLKQLDPKVKTSLLVENTMSPDTNIQQLGFRPDIYSPDFTLLDKAAVENLHRQDISVLPWTINEEDDMIRLAGMGIDGFITDFPERAVKLFNS